MAHKDLCGVRIQIALPAEGIMQFKDTLASLLDKYDGQCMIIQFQYPNGVLTLSENYNDD